MARNIVNIINFIRGCEPRCKVDLVKPVIEQKKLLKTYGFRGTFLLQYDALIDPGFQELMLRDNDGNEVGVWLEIVQPLCEKADIPWRGRFPWDWHANVGFSVGYSPREREIFVDLLFEQFKQVFGYYPRVMGSWIIDAHTLQYAAETYGLDASCNCKDQWGTDGYTLWGAYYNGAYYPSRNNVFAVGESEDEQIDVPIFRMLGSDPILQYDAGLDATAGATSCQGVVTLEPVYHGAGGGEKSWVDWYFRENFNHRSLNYAYTQVGQENSFGWEAMAEGLTYQFEQLSALEKRGVVIEPLGESGKWFKKSFPTTPATAIFCDNDFKNSGKQSVWYNARTYRANLYNDGKGLRLRDMMLFDNRYRERYLSSREESSVLKFDTLPVIDGNRHSGNGVLSGAYLLINGEPITQCRLLYGEKDGALSVMVLSDVGTVFVTFEEEGITVKCHERRKRVSLLLTYADEKTTVYRGVDADGILLMHNGYRYRLYTPMAAPSLSDKGILIPAEKNTVILQVDT